MDRPIPRGPPIQGGVYCKKCGWVVEGERGDDKTQDARGRRRGRKERPLREHLLAKLNIDKVQLSMDKNRLLVESMKEKIIYLYGEKEKWKELAKPRKSIIN